MVAWGSPTDDYRVSQSPRYLLLITGRKPQSVDGFTIFREKPDSAGYSLHYKGDDLIEHTDLSINSRKRGTTMRKIVTAGFVLLASLSLTACGISTEDNADTGTEETSSAADTTQETTSETDTATGDGDVVLGQEFITGNDTFGHVGVTVESVEKVDSCEGYGKDVTAAPGNVLIIVKGELNGMDEGGMGPSLEFYDNEGYSLENKHPLCHEELIGWTLNTVDPGRKARISETFEVAENVAEIEFDDKSYAF